MLETAMNLTGAAPTVLVVDNFQCYKENMPSEWEPLLVALADGAIPLKQIDEISPAVDSGVNFQCFDNYDMLFRRGSSTDPLKCPENGVNLWIQEGDNWTPRFSWKQGTYYIFTDSFEDFNPQIIGPSGYLCMNGYVRPDMKSKRTGYMIREAIWAIKPCILFDNTGSETQMYARLINRIKEIDQSMLEKQEQPKTDKKRRKTTAEGRHRRSQRQGTITDPVCEYYEDLKIVMRNNAFQLREYANQGHSQASGARRTLNMADVVQIIDLYCENPRLFTKVVVPVDPLNASPEEIVRTMTLSFARSLMEAREVGAGDADKKAVEQAWRFHYQLHRSKAIKRRWRTTLYSLYIIVGCLTTLVAVLSDYINFNIHRWLSMALALTVSVCAGILSLISADSQLNQIQAAQAKIAYEVHRFRMVSFLESSCVALPCYKMKLTL